MTDQNEKIVVLRPISAVTRLATLAGLKFDALSIDRSALLGEPSIWSDQAKHDYATLFSAMSVLERSDEGVAAFAEKIGLDALTDLGTTLADLHSRFAAFADLAEAAAVRIAVNLARNGGEMAALGIADVLESGSADSEDDAPLIQACAEADRLDRESRDFDVAAEVNDGKDPALASRYHADATRLADEWKAKVREIALIPSAGPAGKVAKARLLFDLVDSEADGKLPEYAYPDALMAFSLAADILGRQAI